MRPSSPDRLSARAEVISTLRQYGPMSQARLARIAQLAPSTLSPIFATLHREGILAVVGSGPVASGPRGGRPSTLWCLRSSIGVVIGIDFGKQHVRIAVADLAHEILSEKLRRIRPDSLASLHISAAVALIDDALAELSLDRSHVMNVGAGIPGPIRLTDGHLGDSTILPGWVGVDAAEELRAALSLPVEVANDANLGALGEWMWGAAHGYQDAIYLKLSTGIGGGLIINGSPYSGTGGTAGELGHIVIDPGGPLCRCGNRGCLETIAGTATVLGGMSGADAPTTVPELVAQASAGDERSLRAITDAGAAIGAALATVCNLFNPARIVIGGELALAGEQLIHPIQRALHGAALVSSSKDVDVVLGTLKERAEVLGAVALALRGKEVSEFIRHLGDSQAADIRTASPDRVVP